MFFEGFLKKKEASSLRNLLEQMNVPVSGTLQAGYFFASF